MLSNRSNSWVFPALKSTSHFLLQSILSRRSDSSSEANSSRCHRSDVWSHLGAPSVPKLSRKASFKRFSENPPSTLQTSSMTTPSDTVVKDENWEWMQLAPSSSLLSYSRCNLGSEEGQNVLTKDTIKAHFRKHKKIIQELFKVQNPCFDQNPEACRNFGILVKKNISVMRLYLSDRQ